MRYLSIATRMSQTARGLRASFRGHRHKFLRTRLLATAAALMVAALLAGCGAVETLTSAPTSPAATSVPPAAPPSASPTAVPEVPATTRPGTNVPPPSPAETGTLATPAPPTTPPTSEATSTPAPTHTPHPTAPPPGSDGTAGTGGGTVTKEPQLKDGTDGGQTPDGEAATVVRLAMEDLAHRLEVPVDTISLVAAEPVDWPDTSLGNPRPEEFYATVITPGTGWSCRRWAPSICITQMGSESSWWSSGRATWGPRSQGGASGPCSSSRARSRGRRGNPG